MAERLIGYEDLKQKGIPYTKQHLWRLERQSAFPKRVPLSATRVAWVESEIDAYVQAKISARSAPSAQAA